MNKSVIILEFYHIFLQGFLLLQELQFAHRFKEEAKGEKQLGESDSIPERDNASQFAKFVANARF